jgi:hypothetical protein
MLAHIVLAPRRITQSATEEGRAASVASENLLLATECCFHFHPLSLSGNFNGNGIPRRSLLNRLDQALNRVDLLFAKTSDLVTRLQTGLTGRAIGIDTKYADALLPFLAESHAQTRSLICLSVLLLTLLLTPVFALLLALLALGIAVAALGLILLTLLRLALLLATLLILPSLLLVSLSLRRVIPFARSRWCVLLRSRRILLL